MHGASDSTSEQGGLRGRGARRGAVEVFVREARSDAAARGAGDEAGLEEEGFVVGLERGNVFSQGGGQRLKPGGASVEGVHERGEDSTVHGVEALVVDIQFGEGFGGDGIGDDAVGFDLGKVADAAQQAVADAGRCRGNAGRWRGRRHR